MALADIRARHHDFRAHGLQVEDLLAAHLVGDHEHELVALARRDEREAEARVARGRLHDRAAWLQGTVAFRRLDHRKPDAILDRPAGILVLELEEEAALADLEALHLDDRGVPDERENRIVHGFSARSWRR